MIIPHVEGPEAQDTGGIAPGGCGVRKVAGRGDGFLRYTAQRHVFFYKVSPYQL